MWQGVGCSALNTLASVQDGGLVLVRHVLLPHVAGEGNAEQVGGGERVVRGENEEIEW